MPCSKTKFNVKSILLILLYSQVKDLQNCKENQPKLEQREKETEAPFTMNIELNYFWLILVGLSFGTRIWQLTSPKHVM